MMEAGIGRYGPYVKHGRVYANLTDVEEVFTIGMNRAVEVLAQKATRGAARGAAPSGRALRELGEHPEGGAVSIMDGRYGPYVKWGKLNATLPKDAEAADLSMETAVELLAAKAGKKGGAKKAAPKKAAPKKAAVKKPAAKKAPSRKAATGT
jgi:DNA topoisomerase-1